LLIIACAAGYGWLGYSYAHRHTALPATDVCLWKHATNLPCPSCGSTRSVMSLAQGEWLAALLVNPLGYLVALIMLVTPLWILADLLYRSDSFFRFYKKAEEYLKRPRYAVPLLFLVLINWLWNISKGL